MRIDASKRNVVTRCSHSAETGFCFLQHIPFALLHFPPPLTHRKNSPNFFYREELFFYTR